jgi:hypothetical protein
VTPGAAEALIAFYRARLDEDEALAREAAGLTECWVAEESAIGVVLVDGEPLIEGHITGLTAHIARHDPGRVLREAEAGRLLLMAYEDRQSWADDDDPDTGPSSPEWEKGAAAALLAAVQLRAAVHDGHPDYRQEWKP